MRSRSYRSLAALVAAVAVAYSLYGLFRHWHFGSSAYDLGIFDQVVWHLSRFEVPSSTIRGYTNMLGDHFSPIMVLLAPLYWVVPGPETLIVAQAVLLALSLIPVYLYAHRRLPRGAAFAITAAGALFWGMQRAAAFDFHEVAFAPLCIASAIFALDERRWILFWASALALIAVKEDLIPLIGGLGLVLAMRGDTRQALIAVAVSCMGFVLVIGVLIPALSDGGQFGYVSTYSAVIDAPWRIPLVMFAPLTKLRTMLLLLAPFLFLPLLSPLAILILPFALERFLSSTPNHWGTAFHYWAPLGPVLAMASADALVRVRTWLARRGTAGRADRVVAACAGACLVLAAVLPGHQPLLRIVRPGHYRASLTDRTGHDALAMIPQDAAVVAQAAVVPHLSNRDRLFMLDATAPDADFVIVARGLDPWPLSSFEEWAMLIESRRQRGYETVFDRDGWLVLRQTRVDGGAGPNPLGP